MRVSVTTRSSKDAGVREYAEEKLERLDRHAHLHEARLTLDFDGHRIPPCFAEVVAHVDRAHLVAKVEATTEREAVDLVVDKMDAQVRRHKDRLTDHKGGIGADGRLASSPPTGS
jgi:putative sigma-54 modulation protein